MSKISPIISPAALISLQQVPGRVIVDARTGSAARSAYENCHLEGALFVDLEKELADIKPDAANGGRHPLPTPKQFARVIALLGIGPTSHVIVYDDKNASSAAARFWWMLRSIGHEKVQVIDGGFDAAVKAGFQTSSGVELAIPAEPFGDAAWQLPLSNIEEVEKAAADKTSLVIDVRDKYRYDGISEPIDPVAGHIPGAINLPFTSNLNSEGFFRSREELRNIYLAAVEDRKTDSVIVHCGSGVTACHTLLAMDYAGIQLPNLYVGSWSEWSRRDKPIATKENETGS